MKKYWDNNTKPSTWVIEDNDEELFRGAYKNGVMYLKSLENEGMISFKDDYLPATTQLSERGYRALVVQKELRRDIMKLKKEIKALKENGSNLLDNGDDNHNLGENLKALDQW